MSTATLSRLHRRDLKTLTGLASNDLSILWKQFDSATSARDGLMDMLPQLMDVYGSAATSLGADYYDEVRDLAGVKGRFSAIPAELPDLGRTDALARWGVGPLFSSDPDFASAFTLVNGGLQRIIADADRQTVLGSVSQDRAARGWRRVGEGSTCSFCDMLIGRGGVYSEGTADFLSHDNCHCVPEPAFG